MGRDGISIRVSPARFRHYEFTIDFTHSKAGRALKWNPAGARDGDVVFVSGHPGGTDRLLTVAELEMQRDQTLPNQLKSFKRRRKLLQAFSAKGEESARRAESDLLRIENGLKSLTGEYGGLVDPAIFGQKKREEADLRAKIAADPSVSKSVGTAFDDIAGAEKAYARFAERYAALRFRAGRLPRIASNIVRLTAELPKPNGKRLEEYQDAGLDSLYHSLYSKAPIYSDLEETLLADALAEMQDLLGAADPGVKAALGARSPAEAAHEAVSGTKLFDSAARKALVESGVKGVAASTDSMIALARRIDPIYRELRKKYEDEIRSVVTRASEKISRSRFAIYGKENYPDATFTLRLSYGRVTGYELGGIRVPSKTTFHGLFDRSMSFESAPPFDLPERWIKKEKQIAMNTPLDFANSTDIIGGNSGSPTVDANGDLVGLIFDGNIQSLVASYIYEDVYNRAISVHAAAILEALRSVYDRADLVEELLDKAAH